jgi:hypothetical protein
METESRLFNGIIEDRNFKRHGARNWTCTDNVA